MKTTVIDTCCLLNLYASQFLHEIVSAALERVLIPRGVLSESLYIRQICNEEPEQLIPLAVDVNPFLQKRVLVATDLAGEAERQRFVQLAGIIDDGEAESLAIASIRNFILATDDRRAIRVAQELGVGIITTPDLVKKWVAEISPESEQIVRVIHNIERYGRFKPHRTSPHALWWSNHSE